MRKIILIITLFLGTLAADTRTLIVYYSYTNNVERIISELKSHIDADIIEIEPAEKGLDYAADNYAIGSRQIATIRNNPDNASSYPDIDPVNVNLSDYNCIIIGTPLWWSSMAAPMQTFLFHHGKEMAGKNIGLIVSSASSGINGVEADAKRLIPDGKFISPSLWIRSSQTSDAKSLLENWLKAINYGKPTAGIENINDKTDKVYSVYSLSDRQLHPDTHSTTALDNGVYIINGKKTLITK